MRAARTVMQLLDAARVIQLTPHVRAYLEANDPKALEQLERAIAGASAVPGKIRQASRIEWLRRQIDEQRAWIRSCGGNLDGYVRNYGDPDQPHCYGNGGTAIYRADHEELLRLERELHAEGGI